LITTFFHFTRNILVLFLLFFTPCQGLWAQAAAEYAGATSVSAGTAVNAKTSAVASPVATAEDKKSAHLAAPVGARPEVVNRQALEQRAGRDACKLLVRSQPSAAGVWIDGAFVGSAPLLLVLPPGKFKVELRGTKSQYASQAVALLPRETREVTVTLAVRYPTRATVR
jgi:PEGA domain